MKQADKKATSTFIAPTSVELVDNAVVVKGINSATGKPYTCTYWLKTKALKARKSISTVLSPDTFFGKGGVKEALVNAGAIDEVSAETLARNERQEASNKIKRMFA